MTKVSVVIPTYNRGDILSDAISSALSQTVDDIEVIVVDDGSTDDTQSVVNEFPDRRLQLIQHEVNKGGSAARNTGIKNANGDYIAFLDSDDRWDPTKLERQIKKLENSTSEWGACYCLVKRKRVGISKIRKYFTDSNSIEGGDELIPYILSKRLSIGGSSTLLVNTTVIKTIGGFDEKFQRHQDLEFIIRVLKNTKLHCVDEELVTKKETGSPEPRELEVAKFSYLNKFIEDVQRSEDEGFRVFDRHFFQLAKSHFKNGNYKRGLSYLPVISLFQVRDIASISLSVIVGKLR